MRTRLQEALCPFTADEQGCYPVVDSQRRRIDDAFAWARQGGVTGSCGPFLR